MTTATKHLADTVTRLTTTLSRLDADTIDRILTRLNDAKRGYPGGSDSIGAGRSDRTATLATTPTRDRAATDLADLTRSVDLAWQLIITLDRIHANYGTLSIDRSCVECRKTNTLTPIDAGRYRDRCRFHGDARLANQGRDTPIAITQAHQRGQPITDRLIRANPIHILDSAGRDTGRRVNWQRPKRRKR